MKRARWGVALGLMLGWTGACNQRESRQAPTESGLTDGDDAGDDDSAAPTSNDSTGAGDGDADQASGESGSSGSTPNAGGAGSEDADVPSGPELGEFPFLDSPTTRGGTMTFLNIGAPGAWPRRLDRPSGDPACDYKDGEDTWGGHCCQTLHHTTSDRLAPFDEEMTLILKAISVKQLAIYQPQDTEPGSAWRRVTSYDQRGTTDNLWFTQQGDGSVVFPGDLTKNDCVGYVMQEPGLMCGDGRDYYCPNDPGTLHRGFSGSKLVVLLASMDVDDERVTACGEQAPGHPGPWVAFVASELVRDGGRKWNGLCNCYSQTGTVGDGCGEINVFEVVMDDNEFSNREFASTGMRSYQAGHVGGAVCKSDCERNAFLPADVDVVDACGHVAYSAGPEIVADGATDGCPVWRRPQGERYFFILLDEQTRTIQVAMVHPRAIPAAARALLPHLPYGLDRGTIDALVELRLPQ